MKPFLPVFLNFLVFLVFLLFLMSPLAAANPSGTIIQISHRLPMSASEIKPPRDFYMDLGAKHGVKDGDRIQVSRLVPVMQTMSGQPSHLVQFVLGEATVLKTSDFISLARTLNLVDSKQLPAMNYYQFMLGDSVRSLNP